MSEETPVAKPCPICSKPSVERYRPFCSKRCADVDLGRWFSGSYAIPGGESDEEETPGLEDDVPPNMRN